MIFHGDLFTRGTIRKKNNATNKSKIHLNQHVHLPHVFLLLLDPETEGFRIQLHSLYPAEGVVITQKNMALEINPLEKEIPIGNHHF